MIAPLEQGAWAKKIDATTLAAAAPLKEPTATPIKDMTVAKGFQVELLYSVPKDIEGSWVNLCVDPQGRLIVSDQYGGLFVFGIKAELHRHPLRDREYRSIIENIVPTQVRSGHTNGQRD